MAVAPGEKVYEQVVQETQQVIVNGVTYEHTADIGQVVRACPNSGGPEYIRLQFDHRRGSWLWDAPLDDWDESVSHDVTAEPRWRAE